MRRDRFILASLVLLTACLALPAQSQTLSPRLQALYDRADSTHVKSFTRAPVIGITTTPKEKLTTVNSACAKAVEKVGGIPLLIPPTDSPELLAATLNIIDALLISGGPDVDPAYYGHQPHEKLGEVNDARDVYELTIIRKAHQRGMPIFGICRGMQIINVAMGGTLWQDIPSDFQTTINHRRKDSTTVGVHSISILPNTYSAKVFGCTQLDVNSLHHQCVRDVAPSLKITAWSPDSVPEMLEGYPKEKIFAIQSHPEIFTAFTDNQVMPRFFHFLMDEAREYKMTRRNKNTLSHRQRKTEK